MFKKLSMIAIAFSMVSQPLLANPPAQAGEGAFIESKRNAIEQQQRELQALKDSLAKAERKGDYFELATEGAKSALIIEGAAGAIGYIKWWLSDYGSKGERHGKVIMATAFYSFVATVTGDLIAKNMIKFNSREMARLNQEIEKAQQSLNEQLSVLEALELQN